VADVHNAVRKIDASLRKQWALTVYDSKQIGGNLIPIKINPKNS